MSKSRKPEIDTVNDHIAWSYANLARADAALRDRFTKYQPVHHMIRARLFKGLKNGTMAMRSLYDDERIKMTVPNACSCSSQANFVRIRLCARPANLNRAPTFSYRRTNPSPHDFES
jgi:hypothetical protein